MQPRALVDAAASVFWLDRSTRPPERDPLTGDSTADLVVVGGGYTGLWAALQSLEDDPSRSVTVIDAGAAGGQASGRNGGFCSSSLTHGLAHGVDRFPGEVERLQRLGEANLDGLEASIERHGIDCSFERVGGLTVATEAWQLADLDEAAALDARYGVSSEVLDADDTRARIGSDRFVGGLLTSGRTEALVDPARLAWGLAEAVEGRGGVIHESTPMEGIERSGASLLVRTPHGSIRCGAVLLATNAFPSPLRRIRRLVAPVYDHVLMTEPLSPEQRASVGWAGREGLSDSTNLFHYSRLTDDGRILWGGYDAVYHFGNRIDASLEQRDATHHLLAEQFFDLFPQLEGLRFTHRWGGVIDTCTRFAVTFGTAFEGRVSYAVGYTGLGVAASRFGARVALDLLFTPDAEDLSLDFVAKRPLPFPPEPLRWLGISLTRRELARADRNEGRRGPWLGLLDRLGLGFDS